MPRACYRLTMKLFVSVYLASKESYPFVHLPSLFQTATTQVAFPRWLKCLRLPLKHLNRPRDPAEPLYHSYRIPIRFYRVAFSPLVPLSQCCKRTLIDLFLHWSKGLLSLEGDGESCQNRITFKFRLTSNDGASNIFYKLSYIFLRNFK